MGNKILFVKSKSQNSLTHANTYKDISMNGDTYYSNLNNKTLVKTGELVDVDAVKNAVHNIFSWRPGERILYPEFGNTVYQYLYDKINEFTSEQIVTEVKMIFTRYEPRAIVDKVYKIDNVEDTENNTVNIQIEYHIKGLPLNNKMYILV